MYNTKWTKIEHVWFIKSAWCMVEHNKAYNIITLFVTDTTLHDYKLDRWFIPKA